MYDFLRHLRIINTSQAAYRSRDWHIHTYSTHIQYKCTITEETFDSPSSVEFSSNTWMIRFRYFWSSLEVISWERSFLMVLTSDKHISFHIRIMTLRAAKQLITTNGLQNSFTLYVCVFTVYNNYWYINAQTCMNIYLGNIYKYIYTCL